jgi:predicted Zn-dependent protease
MKKTSSRFARRIQLLCSASALALAGLLISTPANMGGGCSTSNMNIAGLVQGTGQVIQSQTLSEGDELAMGESAVCAITTRYPIWNNDAANRYVNLVGMTVASGCSRPEIPFSFVVLDTDEVNAFSAPGGFVMVTRGALMRMSDESELAGVLGHEIGHVVLRHGFEVTKAAMASEGFKKAASSADSRVQQFGFAVDAMTDTILNKGWDQPQEFAADEQAVKMLIATHYDPAGFERFLGKLNASGGSLMSTHPAKGERLARVTKQINDSGARGKGQALPDRFAANIKTR